MKNNKYVELLNKRLKEVDNLFDVELNPNDPKLSDQITLGDRWDNPAELNKALDMQPLWHARWANIRRKLMNEKAMLQQKLDVYVSKKKEMLKRKIYKRNIKKGMTKNNARPNISDVDRRFISLSDKDKKYQRIKKPLDEVQERLDAVSLVVDAFKERTGTLIALGHMVRSMIEKDLIIYTKGSKKKYKGK